MWRHHAKERNALLVAFAIAHNDDDRWEIVGIRDSDGALRVRHVDRGTKSVFSRNGCIALTRGAAEFIDRVRKMWEK